MTTAESARERDAASATVRYRARFDECGPDGALRASGYLRWAQDVAWVHSERLGFGRDWYADRGLAWLVRATDLVVLAPVATGTAIDATTRVVGWRHVLARRRTDFVDQSGRLVAWSLTDWVMTDEVGSPTRVPAEFPARFAVPAGSFSPTRVVLGEPPDSAFSVRSTVRPHEIDPMGHVNNAVYLDYALDVLETWAERQADRPGDDGTASHGGEESAGALPRRHRLEYLLAAGPNEPLVAWIWPDAGGHCVLLARESGSLGDAARVEVGDVVVRSRIGPAPDA